MRTSDCFSVCFSAVPLLVGLLAGCGGGGSGASPGAQGLGSAANASHMPITTDAMAKTETGTGRFLDSAVSGLEYRSGAQRGVTDARGTFTYEKGASIQFKIGGIVLGETAPKDILTPIDLVPGATSGSNVQVRNILRLLQSLDADATPENGICINTTVLSAAGNCTGFVQVLGSEDFAAHQEVGDFLASVGATLCDADQALAHFQQTLAMIGAGLQEETVSQGEPLAFTRLGREKTGRFADAVNPYPLAFAVRDLDQAVDAFLTTGLVGTDSLVPPDAETFQALRDDSAAILADLGVDLSRQALIIVPPAPQGHRNVGQARIDQVTHGDGQTANRLYVDIQGSTSPGADWDLVAIGQALDPLMAVVFIQEGSGVGSGPDGAGYQVSAGGNTACADGAYASTWTWAWIQGSTDAGEPGAAWKGE